MRKIDVRIRATLLLLAAACLSNAWAATLANSGYPTYGANPQRNFQSNRPILCPNLTNGRTTVLNQAWTWPPEDQVNFAIAGTRQITIDERGFLYVQGLFPEVPSIMKIHRNGTWSGVWPTLQNFVQDAYPTHVQGDNFYLGGNTQSVRVNSNTMTQIQVVFDTAAGQATSSLVPFGTDHMVKNNRGSTSEFDPALSFYKISTNTLDETQSNMFVGYTIGDVMVYKNGGTEIPISVGTSEAYPTRVASPTWTTDLDRSIVLSMISGDEVILIGSSGLYDYGCLIKLDVLTGTVNAYLNFTGLDGGTGFYWESPEKSLYLNGELIGSITVGESTPLLVEFISGMVFDNVNGYLQSRPILSGDDIAITLQADYDEYLTFVGYQWSTWEKKMVGRIPVRNLDINKGDPVISDDCNLHIVVDNKLHTLTPLPIQNIVPIIECVDTDGYGYFSYNNLESKSSQIPFVGDRNNLTGDATPIEDFAPGRSPYFPVSTRFFLGVEGTFTWTLEDYSLTFTIAPELYCPESISLIIILTADSPFPEGFDQVVRDTFIAVTGISGTRVTIVAKKRSVTQTSTLETELQVDPDPSGTEPSPSQVVNDFVQNQQAAFNEAVGSSEGAPSNLQTDVGGKALDSELQGTIPPISTPIDSVQPVAPQSAPQGAPSVQPVTASDASSITVGVLAIVSILIM